jgi:transaldolase/glucose-6-phosphate isomerase
MKLDLLDAQNTVAARLDHWKSNRMVQRLWEGDASVWSGSDEPRWLGWLRVIEHQRPQIPRYQKLAREIPAAGLNTALLLGMGGSSLCPEVLRLTFGVATGAVDVQVLDSVVPAQVRATVGSLPLQATLAIVASKSGSTIEPNVQRQYLAEVLASAVGNAEVGNRFLAITDPGTKMDHLARELGFRDIVHGDPTIGGRFSALSPFGLVPAALLGIDLADWLDRAAAMAAACGPEISPADNPGVHLGVVIGTLARDHGRDKLTLLLSPSIASLGAWLEQLIAESTGKHGKGIVPIDGEPEASLDCYGKDRAFIAVELASEPIDPARLDSIRKAGHPLVRITLNDRRDLAGEFFRWEIATAAMGAELGINPFDQPDVESAKIKARALAAAFTESGQLPTITPLATSEGIALFADGPNTAALTAHDPPNDLAALLRAHFARIQPGDYFGINAYLERCAATMEPLQRLRQIILEHKHVATTLGFGPRFLHSTGQLHKGGPNHGVFLQITAEETQDLPIPGERFTFGQLTQFQALGDFDVLCERNRRILRLQLGQDLPSGLARLVQLVEKAVRS